MKVTAEYFLRDVPEPVSVDDPTNAAIVKQPSSSPQQELLLPSRNLSDGNTFSLDDTNVDVSNGYNNNGYDAPKIPPALRGTQLDTIQCRADLFKALNPNVPRNHYGLPKWIYRGDVLDYTLFQQPPNNEDAYDFQQQALHAAQIQLCYDEGFPTINTQPLWAKLPWESRDAYDNFTQYLEQQGTRQLRNILDSSPSSVGTSDILQEWYHIYLWHTRVQAFDMFRAVHAARMREQRVLNAEEAHYTQAERLLTSLKHQFPALDFSTVTDPEDYVNILEKVIKIHRVSLGLPAHGNAQPDAPRTTSVELTMRRVATANELTHNNANQQAHNQVDTNRILNDPSTLELAQEMILRVTHQDHKDDRQQQSQQNQNYDTDTNNTYTDDENGGG